MGLGTSTSSPSPSVSLVVRLRKAAGPPSPALSNDLLLHTILSFTPPDAYAPLLVNRAWYEAYIPILYSNVVLRQQADIHSLFLALPSPHPDLKTRSLRAVKRLVLLVGETPPASPDVASGELERWRAAEGEGQNWLPRLEDLQLGWGREGLRDVASGFVSMVDGRGHSLAGEIARLFRVIRPTSLIFRPSAWGCLEGALVEPTETHCILHPATLARLRTLFQPLFERSTPPTSVTYSHLFLHELFLRNPRTPKPTFLLDLTPSRPLATLHLDFAPLFSLPVDGDHGLSLNPWDRRVSIVKQSALLLGPFGTISITGVSPSLRADLVSEATASVQARCAALVFPDPPTSQARHIPEEEREVPDLTPSQRDALFYTTPMSSQLAGWPGSSTLGVPLFLQAVGAS